ncbi:MAG: hypothetical protein AAGC55_16790 [Myxococcota bacterium]
MSTMAIHGVAVYLPDTRLTMSHLVAEIADSAIPAALSTRAAFGEFIRDTLALDSVPVETELTGDEMIGEAIDQVLGDCDVDPEDIDLLVLAQEPRAGQRANLVHYLQYRYRMSNAAVLCLSGNHCANVEVAVATVLAAAEHQSHIQNALIVSYLKPETLERRIIGTYGVEGDCAGAVLLSRDRGSARLVDQLILTNGMLHDAGRDDDYSLVHCKYYIRILQQLVKRNQLRGADIPHVVVQNANPLLIQQCLSPAGLEPDALFTDNFGRHGHLDCLDFALNLRDLLAAPERRPGPILAFGTGWAGTYVASLLQPVDSGAGDR